MVGGGDGAAGSVGGDAGGTGGGGGLTLLDVEGSLLDVYVVGMG